MTFAYLHVNLASCAHEQKVHALQQVWSIRVSNKMHYLHLWAVPNDLKRTEASFSPISMDSLCLQIVQMPIDLEIWQFSCHDVG